MIETEKMILYYDIFSIRYNGKIRFYLCINIYENVNFLLMFEYLISRINRRFSSGSENSFLFLYKTNKGSGSLILSKLRMIGCLSSRTLTSSMQHCVLKNFDETQHTTNIRNSSTKYWPIIITQTFPSDKR